MRMTMATLDRFAELPDDTFERIELLARAMEVFREYGPNFPMSYALAFLLVALKPGRGVNEYAKEMGSLQPVASRALLEIGPKSSRHDREGYGWIDSEVDLNDRRYRKLFLTPKGKLLLKKIDRALGG